MKKTIIALAVTLAAAGAAQAQTTADATPKAYVGIGVAAANNPNVDAYKAGVKLFGGYDFDQNWGLEAGFTRYGNTDFAGTINGQSESGHTRGSNTYVAGKYTLPINDRFSAYGKLGVGYTERHLSSTAGMSAGTKGSDTGLYAGLGAKYKLTENVSLNAEYEHYGKNDKVAPKRQQWSLGASYGF